MENSSAKWWNENKLKLSLIPAIIFWLVSMLCFIFGLSFKNPIGYKIADTDISVIIAIALSLANTFVQIIGNDQDQDKMDWLFKLGWYGSYILGIGSFIGRPLNININLTGTYWTKYWEYVGEIKWEHKNILISMNYDRIKDYNELNLKLGYIFNY